MLPNAKLMARAFHRVPPSIPSYSMAIRRLSTSSKVMGTSNWSGSQPEDNTVRETDKHNVQQDATREGKKERAEGEGSRGASERSEGTNTKAKEEFPEAPDTIGMQDDRGHNKSSWKK